MLELAWLGTESNQFGTDEFMQVSLAASTQCYPISMKLIMSATWQWCKEVGAEPVICVNMGSGTVSCSTGKDAAWMESPEI